MKERKSSSHVPIERKHAQFFPAQNGAKTSGNSFFSPVVQTQHLDSAAAPCKPTLKSLKAIAGAAVMTDTLHENQCELALGTNENPGMVFSSEVEVPEGCQGRLEYFQLSKICRQRTDSNGINTKKASDDFGVDAAAGLSQFVGNAGTVTFGHTDIPGTSAGPSKHLKVSDSFKMWLLWTPNDAPTVALGMVDWSWRAEASKNLIGTTCKSAWTITDQAVAGGIGVETETLPASQIDSSNLEYVPGTC